MAFKFQNILNYRKIIVDKAFLDFSEILKKSEQLKLKISEANEAVESFNKSYSEDILKISDIHGYNILDARFKSLKQRIADLEIELRSVEQELKAKKKALLTAKIEHEKINKLKEKYIIEDRNAESKREESLTGDISSNRFAGK